MLRRILLLLAAITALLLVTASSALAAAGVQNRVTAFTEAGQPAIGLKAAESPCSHPDSIGSSREIVAGFCVAAEDGLAGTGRDALGRFTGAGGYGADAGAEGLEQYELVTGCDVISDQVRSKLLDGSIRYYDGLSPTGDGTYEGIEVKSGSASLSPGQRAFDAAVNGGTPATATLNGQTIHVTSVELARAP